VVCLSEPYLTWHTRRSSTLTPRFFAYTGSNACSASIKAAVPVWVSRCRCKCGCRCRYEGESVSVKSAVVGVKVVKDRVYVRRRGCGVRCARATRCESIPLSIDRSNTQTQATNSRMKHCQTSSFLYFSHSMER
jgi:hypothetical protein